MTTDSISRYYEAEATCMHCGRIGGVLRSLRPGSTDGALFVPVGSTQVARIGSIADRRCPSCGGPLYAESFELRYTFKPADVPIDRPRRGRPPSWLVAARRRAAEERAELEMRASSA
jgi:hypothetical protein